MNGNRCEGRVSGLNAVIQGVQALQEDRADIVVAGGADSLVRFQPHTARRVGEGAAFVVMRRSNEGFSITSGSAFGRTTVRTEAKNTTPDVGAATGILQWMLAYQARGVLQNVEVLGDDGMFSWLHVSSDV